ncbi:MAG: DUF5069 domain-containing protein [Candidatus Eremiobacteraeota bacterium]|nr:DUF5069 domain-containing protein [Candidatus Eremiobacteraeota bacterium]
MAQTVTKIVPTISTKTSGTSGIVHLPRLWQKLLLFQAGLLPEDYDACGDGFDAMTLNAFGIKKQEAIDFISGHKPSYVEFENWVIEKNGGKLDSDKVRKHNEAILAYNHSDDTAAAMRASSGLKDHSIKDAATLNTHDDFDEFHRHIVGERVSRN